jgi:hypothetical protein
MSTLHTRRQAAKLALLWAAGLAGCASITGRVPPKVHVVGLERLPSESFEIRFGVKLRIQNPGDASLEFDGLSVDLDVNEIGRAHV